MSLESNRIYYENAVKTAELLFGQKLYEDCISYIGSAANYGWNNFTGYYTAYRFESVLGKIADLSIQKSVQKTQVKSRSKKLHVVSQIYKTGGHTRLLFNWIERDAMSDHYILATNQDHEEVKEVTDFYKITSRLSKVFTLTGDHIEKAQQLLNTVLEEDFSQIILHIHPDDLIPVLAFSNKHLRTPVLFLNHADHTFWLGASVTDMVIQIRDSNIQLDSSRRQISLNRQALLPIPVKPLNITQKNNEDKITLLTIGTSFKYRPNSEYNFFKEIRKVVERHSSVRFFIVGVEKDNPDYLSFAHSSITCTGPVTDLETYLEKADIYVEGYPFPSFTALLEASLCRIPFLLHYNPTNSLKLFEDDREHGVMYPTNTAEWHTMIDRLIVDQQYRIRIADEQFKWINLLYSEDAWDQFLAEIDNRAKKLIHKIHSKPSDFCLSSRNEESIVGVLSKTYNYFDHTYNLNFLGRLLVLLRYKHDNPHIVKYSFKERTAYLLKPTKYTRKSSLFTCSSKPDRIWNNKRSARSSDEN